MKTMVPYPNEGLVVSLVMIPRSKTLFFPKYRSVDRSSVLRSEFRLRRITLTQYENTLTIDQGPLRLRRLDGPPTTMLNPQTSKRDNVYVPDILR